MTVKCFNCSSKIPIDEPICPICFAVQKKRFTREEVIDYLEIQYPTKPRSKPKYESTQKPLMQRSHGDWIVFGLATFGIGYYYSCPFSIQGEEEWFIFKSLNKFLGSNCRFVHLLKSGKLIYRKNKKLLCKVCSNHYLYIKYYFYNTWIVVAYKGCDLTWEVITYYFPKFYIDFSYCFYY